MLRYDLQDIELISKSLVNFYAFTGCDTVSVLCGKGKLKPLEVMLKNQKYIDEFSMIRGNRDKWDEQLENCRHLFVMSMDTKAMEQTYSDISYTLQDSEG